MNPPEGLKFGTIRHGHPQDMPPALILNDRHLLQKLLMVGAAHGCPNPVQVALEIGLSRIKSPKDLPEAIEKAEEWLIARQMECNIEMNHVLDVTKTQGADELYNSLTTPKKRLSNEPVGPYNRRLVSSNYAEYMPPGSTPVGYGIPRVKIEEMGRDEKRTPERVEKSNLLVKKAIDQSHTPEELLANLACLVVTPAFGGEGDADALAVLSQTLSATSHKEQGCTSVFKEIASNIRTKSPLLWKFYTSLSVEECTKADIVVSSILSL